MKQSSEPNLDILGVPIGTADFYSAFIFKKHVAVKKLLSSLEEVGAVDPHVGERSLNPCSCHVKIVPHKHCSVGSIT